MNDTDLRARVLTYTAGPSDPDLFVRDVIKHRFRLVAHDVARAKYRTDRGITVNGEVSLVNRRLHPGDVLEVRLAYEYPEHTVPAEGPLSILYEDEDLICLNKPAGVVVHPSHGHFSDSLGNYLAHYFLSKKEPHEIRSVGRLDKDTSGVIIFAKSRTATAILAGQTGEEGCAKEYLALAAGTFAEKKGSVEAPISREYEDKIRRAVREDGSYAFSHYRVLRQYDKYALLSLTIDTGRTHQIRVHMAHIGHPLLGDPIYGNAAASGCPSGEAAARELTRAALHAYRVSFRQPFTGDLFEITAPLPPDMAAFLTGQE